MAAFGGVLAAFGLSAAAGLNAYIPLLIVAVVGRFTNWFELGPTWEPLTSGWVIGALVVLSAIEFFADKAPAANHANDGIQTFIRPAAGAVLFAASTGVVTNINPIIAMIAGLLVAGTVHAVKSVAIRPVVSLTSGGVANTPVSIAEDMIATTLAVLAIVLPVAIGTLMLMAAGGVIYFLWRRSTRRSAAPQGG